MWFLFFVSSIKFPFFPSIIYRKKASLISVYGSTAKTLPVCRSSCGNVPGADRAGISTTKKPFERTAYPRAADVPFRARRQADIFEKTPGCIMTNHTGKPYRTAELSRTGDVPAASQRTTKPYLLYTRPGRESIAECKYSPSGRNIFRRRRTQAKASSSAIPPITAEEEAAPTINAPIF